MTDQAQPTPTISIADAVAVGEGIQLNTLEDGRIVVVLTPGEFGLSGSGKSFTKASTRGNVRVPGTELNLGLNLYQKVPQAAG
jgi:hypothetical protein